MALLTPTNITTAIWLDAADASTLYDATSGGSLVAADGAVARIEDKSGNSRHLTQGTLASRPLRKTAIQNSLDVLRFDGNDWLETTFATWGTIYAVIVVGRSTNATTAAAGYFVCRSNSSLNPINPQLSQNAGANQFNVRDDAGTINATSISGLANNTWYLLGGTRNGNAVTPYRDGTAGTGASNTIGTTTTNRTSLGAIYTGGATPTSYLSGDIGEVIVCGLADRESMEGYTAWKWGLQGSLPANHPYKNGPPVIGGSAAVHFFTFGY